MKNKLKNFFGNFHIYSPGFILILLGTIVLIAPFTLIFLFSSMLLFLGTTYILQVRTAIKQEQEIRNFREFFWDKTSTWKVF